MCAYLRDVASSLALLHSRRLLHCDVSVANIRLTSAGRAKLLDFGALSSFGRNTMVAGAPPTTAPELLKGAELDDRVDLYALGGTAYYALCGRHAYQATLLGLLPHVWALGPPRAPSELVHDIPQELDELVLSLLALDRELRPRTSAEAIDRLCAIASLPPNEDQRVQRSYLYSAVVGRDAQRQRIAQKLRRAISGHGGGALIEGAPGLGKSFLLEDFAQTARLEGARVATINARAHPGPLGSFKALLRDVGVKPPEDGTGLDALVELSQSVPLVLAIDDIEHADPESIGACAQLALAARRGRVLLLAAHDPEHADAGRPGMRLLRERLDSQRLSSFDEVATMAFVTGLFGDIKGAPRLAKYLFNHAAGNPRAYAEVVLHLIEQGHIRYAEGTWVLPDDLPDLQLGELVDAAFERRIAAFSPTVRALAQALTPYRRVFDLEMCRVLAAGDPALDDKDLGSLLAELTREGVLVEADGNYTFGGSRFRDILYARLEETDKRQRHLRIAEGLAKAHGHDPSWGFEIGSHFILAGQNRKARPYVLRIFANCLASPDALVEAVPDLRVLVAHLRNVGADDEDVMWLECQLFVSGYYLDPTVHDRLKGRLLPLVHRVIGLPLADRLAPFLGSHLAFVLGLLIAWVAGVVRKPWAVGRSSVPETLALFVGGCAAWSAAACFRFEREAHLRLLDMFKIAKRFGPFNPLRLIYDMAGIGQDLLCGRFAQVRRRYLEQLERLPRVPGFTDDMRHQYEAGVQFFLGHSELLRVDSQTLACADRIDVLGARHNVLMSQYLRRTHYLYLGKLNEAKRAEDLFDQMAATFGSRWVADVMGVLEFTPYHLSGDVLSLKRSLHRIEQLVSTLAPGLSTHREVLRAMYEGHRGRPDLALEVYQAIDDQLAPFQHPLWAAARAHQAECLNALGRHAEALATCERARAHLTADDRMLVFAYQQLERESAQALAGLGRVDEARRLSDALLDEFVRYENPLVTGLLHFDRARIACAEADRKAFEEHAAAANAAFATTGYPALSRKGQRLLTMARVAGLIEGDRGTSSRDGARTSPELVRNARAEQALDEIVDSVGVDSARLYLVLYGAAVLSAQRGDVETSDLLDECITALARTLDTEVSEHRIQEALMNLASESRSHVQLVPLTVPAEDGMRRLVGLLVLGESKRSGALANFKLSELARELIAEDEATEVC